MQNPQLTKVPTANIARESMAKKSTVLTVMFTLMVSGMGQSFVYTSLPPIGREIGLSEVKVGAIITFGAVLFVIFSFIWGRLIDVIGRRRTIQFGTLVYAITTGLLGYVLSKGLDGSLDADTTWFVSMALRGIFTAGAAGVFPAAQAYFVSISSPSNRTAYVANLGVAFSLGMVIGPAMAAGLSVISLTLPFFFIPVLCLFALTFLQLYMPTMKRSVSAPKPVPMQWRRHPVLPLFVLSLLVLFSMSGIQQITVFYIQDLFQLDPQQAAQRGGIVMTTMSISMILVQLVAVKKLGWSPDKMIYLGVALLFVAMVIFLMLQIWGGVLLGMACFGAGIGFLFPSIVASQTLRAAQHEQTHIAGANAGAQGLGIALGPIICASLYQLNMFLPFVAVCCVAVTIGIYFNLWQRHYPQ